jgi:hypothetical protein
MAKSLGFLCLAFLFAYGPLYRYLRGIVDWPALTMLAYQVLVAAFVLGCLTIPAWWKGERTYADRAIAWFSGLILISLIHAFVTYPVEVSLQMLRAYILPLGVYYLARSMPVESHLKLLKVVLLFSLASVPLLAFEFYQLNILDVDPRDSIVASVYTRAQDFDPREYQAYFAEEAWRLPVIGFVVRPFGTMGAPQISGLYYVFMFWIAYFFLEKERKAERWLFLTAFAAAVILTVSRTAMLALLVSAIAALFINGRGGSRVFTIGALLIVFIVGLYPSFEALLNPERQVGVGNLSVFLKDLAVFFVKESEALMRFDLLGFFFGMAREPGLEAFGENGIISPEYYFNELTDVGILQVIYGIGVLPFLAMLAVFLTSCREMLKHDAGGRLQARRKTFVYVLWLLMLFGTVHYLASTVYCLSAVIMLLVAYASVVTKQELRQAKVPQP